MGLMGERAAEERIEDSMAGCRATIVSVDGRSVVVSYDNGMSPRIMEWLPTFVGHVLFLVPARVRRIWFTYTPRSGEGNSDYTVPMSVTTSDDYLSAHVEVSDDWLSESDYERCFSVMHEFVHLHESECYHFARRLIEEMLAPGDTEPGPREKALVDEYRRKYEAQTQELTHVLMLRLWPEIQAGLVREGRGL